MNADASRFYPYDADGSRAQENQGDGPYLNDEPSGRVNTTAVGGRSYQFQANGNHVREIQEEHPYLGIEDLNPHIRMQRPHQPIPDFQPAAPSKKEKKTSRRSFITTFVIAASMLALLGLAIAGIILAVQEKLRLDKASKINEEIASELREKNQAINTTFLEKLSSLNVDVKDIQRQFQDNEIRQNQSRLQLIKGATSCEELRDKYGVSESGIYQMKQNGSNHPVYSYCDFRLRTGKDTCDFLLRGLESDFNAVYFWVRENARAQPNFKFCFKGPSSCKDLVQKTGAAFGGIFKVYPTPGSLSSKEVYCDRDGWTVFQRRKDGSVNFYRTWDDYVNGFGDMNGEFWLGLETIYQLTKDGDYKLRLDLGDFYGNKSYAEYGRFSISSASDKYRLSISTYSGNAGNSLAYHNGMAFSTKYNDNDEATGNCAYAWKGAWWYNKCHHSNLNGKYHSSAGKGNEGVVWQHWKSIEFLRFTEMKFKKNN